MHAQVPGLCYAVVTADSILDIQYLGVRRLGSAAPIDAASRFRIGSNTKAVTAAIAAGLVQRGLISWDTEFFDLLPELLPKSARRYRHMTLRQLLDFQVKFPAWTYTDTVLTRAMLHATGYGEERAAFVQYFLQQSRVTARRPNGFYMSNVSYAAAGLMLERAAHRSYPELVQELNETMHTDFAIGEPNVADSTQTWGHDAWLRPQPPTDGYKLNWLMAAGNLNTTLTGYIPFIQALLRSATDMDGIGATLHGRGTFSMGWYHDDTGGIYNLGNPGTYVSQLYILPDRSRAVIILTNAQNEGAYKVTAQIMLLFRGLLNAR
ncbi:MAG: beta-lactamase family protein [Bacteroidetes bacterium]|nr:beta-lactamase family protein [Bacteroidota bacterium]